MKKAAYRAAFFIKEKVFLWDLTVTYILGDVLSGCLTDCKNMKILGVFTIIIIPKD